MANFVRVSYVVPRDGQVNRVREVLDKLAVYYSAQPGYLGGYVLLPHPAANPPALGRFGVWASDTQAEEAAQTEYSMALRADLQRMIHEDSHLELTFEGVADPKAP